MDIDNLKSRLEHLDTWQTGNEPLPAIEPAYHEALRLLRQACEDGDYTAYGTLAALFDTPQDAPAGRVLKNIGTSVRHLSDRWQSELEELLFDEENSPPTGSLFGKRKKAAFSDTQARLHGLMEEISRQRKSVEDFLEQEKPEIERADAMHHPQLENIKYIEDPATLEKLSVDLMKLYTHHRKALSAAVERIEEECLVRLKESLAQHLGKHGKDLAAELVSLETEDEIDILKKVYPGGPTDLTRLMAGTTDDEEDRELLLQRAFVFEDMVILDDRAIQKVLRRVSKEELMTALKGVDEEVADKVFRNLSRRAAEEIKEDMDYMGPLRRRDVEKMQDRIVTIIREMEEAGEIYIATSGDDEVVI